MPTLTERIVNKFNDENEETVKAATITLLKSLQKKSEILDLNPVQKKMVATGVAMAILDSLCDVNTPRATPALIKIMRDFLDVLEVKPDDKTAPENETIQ